MADTAPLENNLIRVVRWLAHNDTHRPLGSFERCRRRTCDSNERVADQRCPGDWCTARHVGPLHRRRVAARPRMVSSTNDGSDQGPRFPHGGAHRVTAAIPMPVTVNREDLHLPNSVQRSTVGLWVCSHVLNNGRGSFDTGEEVTLEIENRGRVCFCVHVPSCVLKRVRVAAY